jgi:threonyl-tRNA synthetase
MDYAKEVNDQLQALGFRSEVDERNEKLGKKIRDGETTKIPYMIIVGEKEQEEGTVNVRKRKAKDQIVMPLTELVSVFNEENAKLCRKVKEVPEVESEEDEVTAN